MPPNNSQRPLNLKAGKRSLDSWRFLRFKEIADLGKERISPQNIATGIACIELENISKETGQMIGITDPSKQSSQKNVFYKGNVLFGKLRPYLKKFMYCDFDGVCSSEIWVLSSKNGCQSKFLFYLIQTSQFIRVADQSSGTKMPRADWTNVSKLVVPIPPIPEQEEMIEILSTWDRTIERVQRLIEAKQRQKKGLMQGLLTGRLRFPEFGEHIEEFGNIPEGWKAVEFHDFATRSNKKIDPVTNDLNFRCIELEHISQESGKIIGETESKQQKSLKNYFRPGNVLFGKLRPYLHKFAFCEFEGVCSSEIWVFQNKSNCTSRYLFYLVQTDTFLSASIQTTGTKMPRSDWNFVRKAKFALPTLKEQERITALLDQVELNIELLERYIMRLNQQKKGLMQKLLTGEIRVKVD